MTTNTSIDIVHHPALFNASNGTTHIEDKLYLINNQKDLEKKSYEEFLEIEEIIEDL